VAAIEENATELARLCAQARPFPFEALEGCETGLCLFAAAFGGVNDAVHFAMSGLRTTCVDRDGEALERMRAAYPEDWSFVDADAWTFAEAARSEELSWDAVCVDPFTGDAMVRALETLELWRALADRVLIVGNTTVVPVPGRNVRRAPGVYWNVHELGR